ncbi:hypothetical protein [Rhodohalobacter mucosus]|uniref:Uncharacterized protein n=1 Tax=Rhodohalobacter mucosus TaxID=2079485 RepID=A0A316TLZ9_9BACT|nr:hypothetical protein [Rhodohalobacter mucosus]PWN05419.1 hypothetical protein DDZ15_15240 [Rhodohalobacter mucosus]PWN05420.1 hypothetical protein DDZ15_15245 [Rhodohalobacter mucosus]
MKALKSILSVTLLILFAGCATVTDANSDLNEEETKGITIERVDGTWDNTTDDKMDPIVEKPDMGL